MYQALQSRKTLFVTLNWFGSWNPNLNVSSAWNWRNKPLPKLSSELPNIFWIELKVPLLSHTEIVKVVWNQETIDLSDLLKLFWESHDPTQGNRQGNDHGSQYRSAIYSSNDEQLKLALASRDFYQEALRKKGYRNITTEIKPYQTFYYAEDYHQQYLAKPGSRPYCSAMPTGIILENFPGSNYKLKEEVWSHFDWSINHCVLRSNNLPIDIR